MTLRVRAIEYRPAFIKRLHSFQTIVQEQAERAIDILCDDPFHPSLRLHRLQGKLEGLWSISFGRGYRILFALKENGNALLVTIGTHDIYDP